MRTGDIVHVRVSGHIHTAEVRGFLDRRGQGVDEVDLRRPPPYTTLVLSIEGFEGERVCLPLWLPPEGIELLPVRRAA